jgi:hypothetical protein
MVLVNICAIRRLNQSKRTNLAKTRGARIYNDSPNGNIGSGKTTLAPRFSVVQMKRNYAEAVSTASQNDQ